MLKKYLRRLLLICLLGTSACTTVDQSRKTSPAPPTVRFVVVDPGHYHAALVLKSMYPEASPRVAVYAPLGPELMDFLHRVVQFNSRKQNSTRWELEVEASPSFFDRMLAERKANVAIFSGKNGVKMDRIARAVNANYHVLADKPWIIRSADLPKLAQALDTAETRGLVAYDIMTERYEITSMLQRDLVNSPEVFGELVAGTPQQPAIRARSVHHLMKTVSGMPLRRPAWFMNIEENGEGIADVGTHVVDLVQWIAFPTTEVDYRTDVRFLWARRWPTVISLARFRQLTGEEDFPEFLRPWVKGDRFEYFCNTAVLYTVRGVHVQLDILWNWEAPPGSGDTYEATFRGSLSRIEIRQGPAEKFRPELYVVPASGELRERVFSALEKKVGQLQTRWPGLGVSVQGNEARLLIPDRYRTDHEAHFAEVTAAFLKYLRDPKLLPKWEKSNMLVKYYLCTRSVEIARGEVGR